MPPLSPEDFIEFNRIMPPIIIGYDGDDGDDKRREDVLDFIARLLGKERTKAYQDGVAWAMEQKHFEN